jgi:HPt (histidine-containing phosphotransfer) domain-containing protein
MLSIQSTAALNLGVECERSMSLLMDDPELRELLREFVAELPQRFAALEKAAAVQDWQEVRRLAHQLKGSGGSYGFPAITAAAAEVEEATREPAWVGKAIASLSATCEEISRLAGVQPLEPRSGAGIQPGVSTPGTGTSLYALSVP